MWSQVENCVVPSMKGIFQNGKEYKVRFVVVEGKDGINTSQPRKPAAQGEWSSSGENLEQDLPDQRRRIRQIRRCIPRFRWTWRTSTSGSRWYDQASPDTIQKNIWGSPETAARTSKRVWARKAMGKYDFVLTHSFEQGLKAGVLHELWLRW